MYVANGSVCVHEYRPPTLVIGFAVVSHSFTGGDNLHHILIFELVRETDTLWLML
jgi:hypothetical protein